MSSVLCTVECRLISRCGFLAAVAGSKQLGEFCLVCCIGVVSTTCFTVTVMVV